MTNIDLFINNQPRNKLVIHSKKLEGLKYCDIGLELSEFLKNKLDDPKIALKSMFFIDDLLTKKIDTDPNYGQYIAIKNTAIMLEPVLKIDLRQILDKYSRTNTMFLLWEGKTENNSLYFLSIDKGIKINLKDLSHIMI